MRRRLLGFASILSMTSFIVGGVIDVNGFSQFPPHIWIQGYGFECSDGDLRIYRIGTEFGNFIADAPSWPILLTFLIAPLVWVASYRRPHDAHSCNSCAYNLSGNTSGTCPECGTPIPSKRAC